jgi:hypothetical protein
MLWFVFARVVQCIVTQNTPYHESGFLELERVDDVSVFECQLK